MMREFIGEKNQRIRIGRDIVITILKICAGRVKYVLDAPRGMEVVRERDEEPRRQKGEFRNQSFRFAGRRLGGAR